MDNPINIDELVESITKTIHGTDDETRAASEQTAKDGVILEHLEEAVQRLASDMADVRASVADVHKMCVAQVELTKSMYHQNKTLTLQSRETQGFLVHLSRQVQSLAGALPQQQQQQPRPQGNMRANIPPSPLDIQRGASGMSSYLVPADASPAPASAVAGSHDAAAGYQIPAAAFSPTTVSSVVSVRSSSASPSVASGAKAHNQWHSAMSQPSDYYRQQQQQQQQLALQLQQNPQLMQQYMQNQQQQMAAIQNAKLLNADRERRAKEEMDRRVAEEKAAIERARQEMREEEARVAKRVEEKKQAAVEQAKAVAEEQARAKAEEQAAEEQERARAAERAAEEKAKRAAAERNRVKAVERVAEETARRAAAAAAAEEQARKVMAEEQARQAAVEERRKAAVHERSKMTPDEWTKKTADDWARNKAAADKARRTPTEGQPKQPQEPQALAQRDLQKQKLCEQLQHNQQQKATQAAAPQTSAAEQVPPPTALGISNAGQAVTKDAAATLPALPRPARPSRFSNEPPATTKTEKPPPATATTTATAAAPNSGSNKNNSSMMPVSLIRTSQQPQPRKAAVPSSHPTTPAKSATPSALSTSSGRSPAAAKVDPPSSARSSIRPPSMAARNSSSGGIPQVVSAPTSKGTRKQPSPIRLAKNETAPGRSPNDSGTSSNAVKMEPLSPELVSTDRTITDSDVSGSGRARSRRRSRSHHRSRSRSRSPPHYREGDAYRQSTPSRPHSRLRESGRSPVVCEMVIKGSTKHRLSADDRSPYDERRSPKRQHVSPRAQNIIMFSDNDGDDDSGSDSDLGNIRRVKRESGELDIGIVGASGSSRKDRQPDDTISRRLGPRVSSYVSDGDDYVSSGELGDVWYSSGAPAAQYGGRQHSNNGVMWDMSGIEITSDRMSYLLGPFVFLGLPVMPNVYSMMFGCQPLRTGVPLNMLQRYMTSLDRFKFWGVPNYRSDGSRYGMACFIARDGRELAMARRRIENRLLKNSAVLGPLLCYFIITLGCNGIDTMAGSVVNDMFFFVTGKRLESLDIVTERGIVHMPISQIWNMAKDWAVELTQLAARGRRMQDSLDECDRVNDEYLDRCRTRGYSMSEMDPDGDIARDMLSKSRYTHLFLGIQSSDLKQLYIYIGYMMGGMISREDSKYLKEVSASFRHRMQ